MLNEINIIEGEEPNSDLSHKWVKDCQDIRNIEQSIPLIAFEKQLEKRNLDMEFRLIRRMTETQYHIEVLTDFKPNLSKMNRYTNIIPYKHSTVELKVEDGENEETGAYINASWINSCFQQDKQFIATQGPKPETFANFWKMIWYNNVENIIMLCNIKENDKPQCEQYWPGQEEDIKYSSINVKCQSEETIQQHIIKRTFVLTKSDNQSNGVVEGIEENSDFVEQNSNSSQTTSKIVYQYQFLAWPDQQTPNEGALPLVQYIIKQMMESFNNSKKSVVHCSAGIGRTGTLIALINIQLILEYFKSKYQNYFMKMKADNENLEDSVYNSPYAEQSTQIQDLLEKTGKLSIFGIVRRLREQRWGMVHTSEQYNYIYKYVSKILQQFQQEAQESQVVIQNNNGFQIEN